MGIFCLLSAISSIARTGQYFDELSYWSYSFFFQDVENHSSVKPPRSWNNTGSNIDDPTMLITLEDCLQSFINWENLDSKEMFNCKRCKQLQPAEKKLDIWKLPPCLVSECP